MIYEREIRLIDCNNVYQVQTARDNRCGRDSICASGAMSRQQRTSGDKEDQPGEVQHEHGGAVQRDPSDESVPP